MSYRIFTIILGAWIAGAAFPGVAIAKERVLKCELRQDGAYRATPPEVVVGYMPGQSKMVVYDSILAYYERDPVLGTVSRDDAKTFVLRWRLTDLKTSSGETMDWRFTLAWDKKTGRANIRGGAAVNDDDNNGSGKCFFKK